MNTVYGAILSPFVRKVIISMKLKGLEYNNIVASPHEGVNPKRFVEISPLKKMPAFEDDKVALADSSVICEYLEERYPEHPLLPSDMALRGKCRFIEEYADTALTMASGPDLFFQRIVKPLMGQTADESVVETAMNKKIPRCLDYLESLFEGDFMLGDCITMADISVYVHLSNAGHAGFALDASRWPKLAHMAELMVSTPEIGQLLEQEKAMLARLGH